MTHSEIIEHLRPVIEDLFAGKITPAETMDKFNEIKAEGQYFGKKFGTAIKATLRTISTPGENSWRKFYDLVQPETIARLDAQRKIWKAAGCPQGWNGDINAL